MLYVDDEPSLRDLVAELLRRRGYIVDTAGDGTEGWQKVNDERAGFDLVITDRQMPKMDGLIFVRMLRQAKFPGRIIVFSAALTPTCLEELSSLSVDAVVPKGTPAAALLAIVADVTRPR
ncbi:MAG TPA: response regulator [Opitutaceae bacterium]|nr:response regulator [Opitutaceae bacterium]